LSGLFKPLIKLLKYDYKSKRRHVSVQRTKQSTATKTGGAVAFAQNMQGFQRHHHNNNSSTN